MNKYIFLIIFILINLLLFSQDDYKDLFDDLTDDSTKEEITSSDKEIVKRPLADMNFNISLIGTHAFEFHVPVIKDNLDFDGYIKSPKIKNDFGIEVLFKNLTLISHWQFDIILNKWGDIQEFLEMLPLENYIAWSPWKLRFAIGFQNYNWGTGDKINPTDNVNLRDYRIPFNPRKIPVFSVSASIFPADFISIEALYIPFYLQISTDLATSKIEELYSDARVRAINSINPGFFGLGGKVNFYLRHADFSFSYLTQIDPYYSLDLYLEKKNKGSSSYYSIDKAVLVNGRLHNIGADFRTTAGIFGLWLEACYTISEDFFMDKDNIRNHQLKWVTGFDFNYGPDSAFYFNIQYFGYYNPLYYYNFYNDYENGDFELDRDESYYEKFYYRRVTDTLALVTEGFLHGLSLNMEWPVLNSLLTPRIKAIYSIPLIYDTNREARYGNLYINPEIDIMPLDSFHILIGSDLFFSWHKLKDKLDINTGNLFGSNYTSSNIYLEVRYKWGIDFKK